MQAAQEYVAKSNQDAPLVNHGFFDVLRQPEPNTPQPMAFAQVFAYWVMSFQDVIRINFELAKDPSVRELLRQHVSEDSGHEQWFLHDLDVIFGKDTRGLSWLFDQRFFEARRETLAIASEVFHMKDDRLRLVYVDILESTSRAFIEHVNGYVKRVGLAERCKYFGRTHADAEAGHEMFSGGETEARIKELALPDALLDEARVLIDRVMSSFLKLADLALESMTRSTERPN